MGGPFGGPPSSLRSIDKISVVEEQPITPESIDHDQQPFPSYYLFDERDQQYNPYNLSILRKGDLVIENDTKMVGIITATPDDAPDMHSYPGYRQHGHFEMRGDDGKPYNKNQWHFRRIKPEYRKALYHKAMGN